MEGMVRANRAVARNLFSPDFIAPRPEIFD
jgi:hypothetical protein